MALLPNARLESFSWTLLVVVTVAIGVSASRFRPLASGISVPLALMMALVNYTTANYAGLLMGRILQALAP